MTFLDQITLKTAAEKEAFAQQLRPSLRKLKSRLVTRHLLKLLLSRVMLVEACMADIVQDLLVPSDDAGDGVLSETEYRAAVLPRVVELYHVHDRDVRLSLLANIRT
jgi:hypothetical protein